jgi:hypothetical protein
MWTLGSKADQPIDARDKAMQSTISEEEIDAAVRAIEMRLIAGHELGFQYLRTNFSGEVMARAALEAVRRAT